MYDIEERLDHSDVSAGSLHKIISVHLNEPHQLMVEGDLVKNKNGTTIADSRRDDLLETISSTGTVALAKIQIEIAALATLHGSLPPLSVSSQTARRSKNL